MKFNFKHILFFLFFGLVLFFGLFLIYGIFQFSHKFDNCYLRLCATEKPAPADILGVYEYERQTLTNVNVDPLLGKKCSLELKANGTFFAKNIPDASFARALEKSWEEYKFKRIMSRDEYSRRVAEKLGELTSVSGKWTIVEVGYMSIKGEGSKTIWGVYLGSKNIEIETAYLFSRRPPYKLMFVFGDPDLNRVLILKKRD